MAPIGIGEQQERVVDVAADFRPEDLRARDLVLFVDLARHDQVILPHQPRVEQAVQEIVGDLGGEGAGAGDVDGDGAHRGVDDLALENAEGMDVDHARGDGHRLAGQLDVDDGLDQLLVDQRHQLVDGRLGGLLGAEGRELGEQERIREDVDVVAVAVLELAERNWQ